MTDDERVQRQIESLFVTFGELTRDGARHDERLDGTITNMAAMEQRLVERIGTVADECKQFRAEYRADRKAALERSDSTKASSRTIVVAMIVGSCTVLAAIVAAIAAVLTGGG